MKQYLVISICGGIRGNDKSEQGKLELNNQGIILSTYVYGHCLKD